MKTELGISIAGPEVSESDVLGLCNALRLCNAANAQAWITARELSALYDYNDRELRAIAEASNGRIISGQRGYALLSNCTPEEVDHAAAWLESQAKKMLQRAASIRLRFHRYGKTCAA